VRKKVCGFALDVGLHYSYFQKLRTCLLPHRRSLSMSVAEYPGMEDDQADQVPEDWEEDRRSLSMSELLEVLETPLTEAEVRQLCEERWQDIKMLLKKLATLQARCERLERALETIHTVSVEAMMQKAFPEEEA
jgi:hypothetical protein